MAKKTNKTDHVLSLLSGGGAKNEAENHKESSPAPPVIPEGTVSVVESADEDGQIADTIRESLEKELENMERVPASQGTSALESKTVPDRKKTETANHTITQDRPEIPHRIVPETVKASGKEAISKAADKTADEKKEAVSRGAEEKQEALRQGTEEKQKAVSQGTEEKKEALSQAAKEKLEAIKAAAEKKQKALSRGEEKRENVSRVAEEKQEAVSHVAEERRKAVSQAAEEKQKAVSQRTEELTEKEAPPTEFGAAQKNAEKGQSKAEVPETRFILVNVMERLVQEKAHYYMEQFGVCTCPRCTADVTALALTKLPPKYVVVNREAVSPLINFYSNKYAGQITVEITKACIRVGENPYHSED